MSIAPGTSGPAWVDWLGILFLGLGPVASLGIGLAAGVFRRRSIKGPERMAPGERPGALFLIALAGFFAWSGTTLFYAGTDHQGPSTRPEARLTGDKLVLAGAVSSLGGAVVLVGGNMIFRRGGLRGLGMCRRNMLPAAGGGLAGIVFVMPLITWAGILTLKLWQRLSLPHPQKHELLDILDRTGDRRLAVLLVFTAVVIAPLFEELFFRGHVQTLFRHLTGRAWVAVALASALFAAVHPWWTVPPILFLAVCLGYAYERTGNLWVPILIHSLFNGISIVVSLWIVGGGIDAPGAGLYNAASAAIRITGM